MASPQHDPCCTERASFSWRKGENVWQQGAQLAKCAALPTDLDADIVILSVPHTLGTDKSNSHTAWRMQTRSENALHVDSPSPRPSACLSCGGPRIAGNRMATLAARRRAATMAASQRLVRATY
ncbi:hypothetical protein AUP68_10123 [Ilyonectria robusta]